MSKRSRVRIFPSGAMQTPILSKQQQKAALSSKGGKKKPEARIRNVYAQPYKAYWPVLPKSFGDELEDLLENFLTPARKDKKKTVKAGVQKINDENFKEQDNTFAAEQFNEQRKLWSFIVRGINEVTRGLEKGTIGCVLLSEDANPQHMVSHIPRMCAVIGVPVIILHFVRSVAKRSLGFSCAALGFKKEATTDVENHFYPLCLKIQQLSENVPPPDLHFPLFNIDFEDMDNKEQCVEDKPLKCSKSLTFADLHLHRSSRKERTFIPNLSDVVKYSSDFIPLSFSDLTADKDGDEIMDFRKTKVHYQPLKVKRIQPNPKKLKRLKAK